MATKIIHKKSSVGSKIPLASDLEVGELDNEELRNVVIDGGFY